MAQTLIITGASRGIGEAAVRVALARGANVVATARTVDRIGAPGDGAALVTVAGDLADRKVRAAIVARALETFGRIDALVNNAGMLEPLASFADSDEDAWVRNMEVNALAPIALARLALGHIRASGGRFVHISSGAAYHPIGGWSAYCAAKAALSHLSSCLAHEEPGIVSVTYSPGLTATDMQGVIRRDGGAGMPPAEHQRFVDAHRDGVLRPVEDAGLDVALLALAAPPEVSGTNLTKDDECLARLRAAHGG